MHSPHRRLALILAVFALVPLLVPTSAQAHGIWGHIHVTGWAIENLPEGSPLHDFFSEPEVLNAALFGAAFTDSGYFPQSGELSDRSRAYSEHTHWEPFIADVITWIAVNDPPPWDTLESRQRVAFVMGCAAHGLQDEIFDTLFLAQVQEHDNAGQAEADPSTDGFLALDGHIRFLPPTYIPMEMLLELYQGLDQEITEDTIRESVGIMTDIYINDGLGLDIVASLGDFHGPLLPWTRLNYMDPSVPGSLRAEIFPTARHLEALWKRFHNEPIDEDALVVFAYPEQPRRLLGADAGSPDSWVSLIFGAGVRYGSATGTWVNDDQAQVEFSFNNTRWNNPWPRIIRLQPNASLTPGGWYTIGLDPGAEAIDGFNTTSSFSLRFQVSCSDENPDDCLAQSDIPVANIDPPDTGVAEDVTEDTTEPDTAFDDVAEADTIETDTIEADTVEADTVPEAEDTARAEPDVTEQDVAERDMATNAPNPTANNDGGCACRQASPLRSSNLTWMLFWLLTAGGLVGLRKR